MQELNGSEIQKGLAPEKKRKKEKKKSKNAGSVFEENRKSID